MAKKIRSAAEIAQIIRTFESEHDAFAHQIENVSLWRLIRFEISVTLQNIGLDRTPLKKTRLIKSLIKAPFNFLRLKKKSDFLIKTFDSAHRHQQGNHFYDFYADPLLEHFPKSQKMSSCDANGYENNINQACHPIAFDDTFILIISALMGRFFPKIPTHSTYENLSKIIQKNLNLEKYTTQYLSRITNTFLWRCFFYEKLLKKIQPKAVLCADSGQFALIKAAQKCKIPFIEIQHGVFTHIHPNALTKETPKENIPALLLADYFAAYGQFFTQCLDKTLLAKEARLKAVGTAFIDHYRQKRQHHKHDTNHTIITFTTQGIETKKLIEYISLIAQKLGHTTTINVKLHPAYNADTNQYENAFKNSTNIKIFKGHESPTAHDLIAISDLHVSISSTCHYDALGIGTPTAILALDTHKTLIELIENKDAPLIESPQALVDFIKNKAYVPLSTERQNFYFTHSYLENIRFFLDRAAKE